MMWVQCWFLDDIFLARLLFSFTILKIISDNGIETKKKLCSKCYLLRNTELVANVLQILVALPAFGP